MMCTVHPFQLEVQDFESYARVIDVRSPAEFREDHIPGAVNLPVVDDHEFETLTDLLRSAPAEAEETAGRWAARNIRRHLDGAWPDAGTGAEYLVYSGCGAHRSRLFAAALRSARACRVDVLPGGWRAYRRWVSAGLFSLPGHYNYRVLCAPLGSGQDRFLQALSDAGEQVLDLRSLAGHPAMASIAEGHRTQPTQAQFDGNLVDVLRKCDPERPVWTEAVGQTLGGLSLPKGLVDGMLHSQPVFLEVPMAARVRWWQESSSSIAHNPPAFVRGLAGLAAVVGAEKFGEWSSLAGRGRVDELLERILVHYLDPSYRRSILRNFADIAERGLTLRLRSLCAEDIQAVVEGVLDQPADDERGQAPSPLTMIAHTFTGS